jgi:hypothetical protein
MKMSERVKFVIARNEAIRCTKSTGLIGTDTSGSRFKID